MHELVSGGCLRWGVPLGWNSDGGSTFKILYASHSQQISGLHAYLGPVL